MNRFSLRAVFDDLPKCRFKPFKALIDCRRGLGGLCALQLEKLGEHLPDLVLFFLFDLQQFLGIRGLEMLSVPLDGIEDETPGNEGVKRLVDPGIRDSRLFDDSPCRGRPSFEEV